MRRVAWWGGLACWLAFPHAVWAFKECPNVSTYTDGQSGAVLIGQSTQVCGYDFLATAANGFFELLDASTGLASALDAVIVSENGAATSGNGASLSGMNLPIRRGLGVIVAKGRLTIRWGQ